MQAVLLLGAERPAPVHGRGVGGDPAVLLLHRFPRRAGRCGARGPAARVQKVPRVRQRGGAGPHPGPERRLRPSPPRASTGRSRSSPSMAAWLDHVRQAPAHPAGDDRAAPRRDAGRQRRDSAGRRAGAAGRLDARRRVPAHPGGQSRPPSRSEGFVWPEGESHLRGPQGRARRARPEVACRGGRSPGSWRPQADGRPRWRAAARPAGRPVRHRAGLRRRLRQLADGRGRDPAGAARGDGLRRRQPDADRRPAAGGRGAELAPPGRAGRHADRRPARRRWS